MEPLSWLFLSAALSGPPQSPPPGAAVPAAIRANFDISTDAGVQRRQGEPGRAPDDERPHRIGVGPSISGSNRGVGGATRLFFNDRIGVDFQASWYRPHVAYGTGSIFHATPSFLYMLRLPDDQAAVDIRPYVGGGLNYISSSYRSTLVPDTGRRGGTGGQAFVGAELTFKDAQWVTISVEGRYYRLPVRTVNASMIDGMNYVMLFHFYLR